MPDYTKCTDPKVLSIAGELIENYFPDLTAFGVRIDWQFANGGYDKNGNPRPSIKLNGVPCAAKVKVNSQADRAMGLGDVTITLDGDQWEGWAEETLTATIHHELYHLEVQRDKDDPRCCKYDAHGRPKIKLKPHDFTYWGFDRLVAIYGTQSFDGQALEAAAERKIVTQQEMFS